MPIQFNSVTPGLKRNYFCLTALFFWHSPSPFFLFLLPCIWPETDCMGRHTVLTLCTAGLGLGLHWFPPSVLGHVPSFSRALLTVSLGHSWEGKYNSPLLWRSPKFITHSHLPCNIGKCHPKGKRPGSRLFSETVHLARPMALLDLSSFSAATG